MPARECLMRSRGVHWADASLADMSESPYFCWSVVVSHRISNIEYQTYAAATDARAARDAAERTLTLTTRYFDDERARVADVLSIRQRLFAFRQYLEGVSADLERSPAEHFQQLCIHQDLLRSGILQGQLPEIIDKQFHEDTRALQVALTHRAAGYLSHDQVAAVKRTAWLELVLPRLTQFAVWRDVASLRVRWYHSFDGSADSAVRSIVNTVFGGFIVVAILINVIGLMSEGVAVLVGLVGLAGIGVAAVQTACRPRLLRRADKCLALLGETFPRGMSDTDLAATVNELRDEMIRAGIPADELNGDVHALRARLDAENNELHRRTLGRPPVGKSIPVGALAHGIVSKRDL